MRNLDQFHWQIEIPEEESTDYNVTLTYQAGAPLIKRLFKMAKAKMEKVLNKDIVGAHDIVEQFRIPETYKNIMLPTIKKAIKRHFKTIRKEVAVDGIKLLDYEVQDAYYSKKQAEEEEEADWEIKIYIKGQYVDEK